MGIFKLVVFAADQSSLRARRAHPPPATLICSKPKSGHNSHRTAKVSPKPTPWETWDAMKKPELVLTSKPDDDFLTGSCSACGARFRLSGNTLQQKALLRAMFDNHALRIKIPPALEVEQFD